MNNDENQYVNFANGYTERLLRLQKIDQNLSSIYGASWHKHSLNTMRVESLARLLYLNDLYKKIIDVPGVICEFGVRYGASLAALVNLRSIYEPFNVSRTVHGFDTFHGLQDTSSTDGNLAKNGDFSVPKNFEETLKEILELLEADAPMSHVSKFELIKGNAIEKIDIWLDENPHAIISMAIFDMDIYKPTKIVLQKILPRLTKGSLIVFDELNYKDFPGETVALQEVMGFGNVRL